jgi:hypothetical protein
MGLFLLAYYYPTDHDSRPHEVVCSHKQHLDEQGWIGWCRFAETGRSRRSRTGRLPRAQHTLGQRGETLEPTRQKQHRNPTRQHRRAEDAGDHLRRTAPRPGGCSPSGPRWEQRAPALPHLPLPRRRCRSPRPPFIDGPPPPTDRRTEVPSREPLLLLLRAARSTRSAGEYAWLVLGSLPGFRAAGWMELELAGRAPRRKAAEGEERAKQSGRCDACTCLLPRCAPLSLSLCPRLLRCHYFHFFIYAFPFFRLYYFLPFPPSQRLNLSCELRK